MVRVRVPQVGLAVTAAALAVAVSACGQDTNNAQPLPNAATTTPASTSDSPTSGPPSSGGTSATPSQPAGDGLCKAADLRLSIGHGDAGAGTVFRPLIFTNISDRQCAIQGFPGVSYVGGADGHQVGAPAFRTGTKGAAITLNKGETASADIGFVNVQNYDPVDCQPQPVRGLRVYPPQETASLFVDLAGTGCGNANIQGNQLTVKTIEKGSGAQ